MPKGSFSGLYTFEEVAVIYKLDSSTLRKRVKSGKFILDKEVKKFGKTWLITEEAMIKYFGAGMFHLYKNQLTISDISYNKKEPNITIKSDTKTANKVQEENLNLYGEADEDIIKDSWNDEIKGNVTKIFNLHF